VSKQRPIRWCIAALAACVIGVFSIGTVHGKNRIPRELKTPEARSNYGMVATGSPEATEAAVEILEKGGNAIDAAVAAAFMLGVVDSQSSGIGGVTNIVVHLTNGHTFAIDGAPRVPMTIDIESFRQFKKRGQTYGYETIAAPTTLATLEFARSRYGTMSLAALLQPAIATAENGYPLSKIQIMKIRKYYDDIENSSAYLRSLILENGRTIGKPGDRQYQPDLAKTFRRIAAEGVQDFYRGSIAKLIEADMIQGGSFLRRSDLTRVRVRDVRPLYTTYRGFDVFTFPPPGGGAGVVAILNLLEVFPSRFLANDSPERHHLLLNAFRIAAADALRALGRQRVAGMDPLSKRHARARAALIVPGKMVPEKEYSMPDDSECAQSGDNTTQVSVADSQGNIVSMTQTLGRSFGAKVATPGLGFPYNNLLAVFNADSPRCAAFLRPNTPIITDMAPTIVLKDGRLFAALGSPGSNKIPPIISEIISNLVDRNLAVRDAVTAPRVLWGGEPPPSAYVEVFGAITKADVHALEQMGIDHLEPLRYPASGKTTANDFGGVNAVAFDREAGVFTGVGDPRRYGSAKGPKAVAAVDEPPAMVREGS
jgi:gamma-glutamyltranspeptidase/glutathione hydrolase